MRSGFYKSVVAIGALVSLSGCEQMTRHSNMMIFGTNTVLGLRAGVTATSVPEIALGYARQEAVVMPLLANVTESSGSNGSKTLVPCDPTKTAPVAASGHPYVVHPCSFVGLNNDGKILDSYSVLASFGGNFGAEADATGKTAKASGGVAQYFATGSAAQLLALNGGAAVVAVGPTADKAAQKDPVTLDGVTTVKYEAADSTADILEKYLSTTDATAAQHRVALVKKVQASLNKPGDPVSIDKILAAKDSAARQSLITGLLVLEDDAAGKTILNGN